MYSVVQSRGGHWLFVLAVWPRHGRWSREREATMTSSGGFLSRRYVYSSVRSSWRGGSGAILAACGGAGRADRRACRETDRGSAGRRRADQARRGPSGRADQYSRRACGHDCSCRARRHDRAGCGAAAAAKPAASAPFNIRFITWWEPLDKYLVEVTEVFQAANPGLTVTTEFLGDVQMEEEHVDGGRHLGRCRDHRERRPGSSSWTPATTTT